MRFQEQLDAVLLADLLHDKKCNHSHSDNVLHFSNDCDYYMHNKRKELINSVNSATSYNKYHQQAKTIMKQCENMNMAQIISLIKTIIE